MTDPGERTREMLRGSTEVPAVDRNYIWSGMRQRQSRLARRRDMLRWSITGLVTTLAAFGLWFGMRIVPGIRSMAGVPVAADSIPTPPSGAEAMVIQQEAPTALIPLLGNRTQIRMDIDHLSNQRRELTSTLDNPSLSKASRELAVRELAEVEQQLAASKRALAAIDAQISQTSGQPVAIAPVPPMEHVTTHVQEIPVPVYFGSRQMALASSIGILSILVMLAMLLWVRRTARAALREVVALRTQSSTQLNTMTEGIEAIALEVERIGEGQRYLSKAIGAPHAAVPVEQRPS